VKFGVVDVEAFRAIRQAEVGAAHDGSNRAALWSQAGEQLAGRYEAAMVRDRSALPEDIPSARNSHHPFDKVASGSYILVMRSVGLKTLKNKLSEYVRLAAGGETVLVTDRDRVVAEIGPPSPARSSMLSDALLLDAFRQGWMTPPMSVGRGPPARKPVMRIDALLADLQRDRTDR
jgi:antitoxin (DNA-binding transcriptional repressor) of toxin-antitoxin stability system